MQVKSKYICSPEFMTGYVSRDIQCYPSLQKKKR